MTEWISVEKRTPESGVPVLCANADIPISFVAWFYEGEWHRRLSENTYGTIEVLYWQPLPPPPKKKRWMPKVGEEYFCILQDKGSRFCWDGVKSECAVRGTLGVYKKYEEAQEMLDKIKAFVTEQIGEV